MVVERRFSVEGHTIRLTVERGIPGGWEIQEEFDTAIAHVHCDDWHRVERQLDMFERNALRRACAVGACR